MNLAFFAHWVISFVWQCNKDFYFRDVDNYFISRTKGDVELVMPDPFFRVTIYDKRTLTPCIACPLSLVLLLVLRIPFSFRDLHMKNKSQPTCSLVPVECVLAHKLVCGALDKIELNKYCETLLQSPQHSTVLFFFPL